MRILLEGPDCTGKSTLAKMLRVVFPGEYIHLEYQPNDELFKLETNTLNDLLVDDEIYDGRTIKSYKPDNTIVDRHLLSEFVYGSVFRGKIRGSSVIEDNKLVVYKSLTELINSDETYFDIGSLFDLVIIALPVSKKDYLDFFEKHSKTRHEYSVDLTKMGQVYDSYQILYQYLKLSPVSDKIVRYDMFDMFKDKKSPVGPLPTIFNNTLSGNPTLPLIK